MPNLLAALCGRGLAGRGLACRLLGDRLLGGGLLGRSLGGCLLGRSLPGGRLLDRCLVGCLLGRRLLGDLLGGRLLGGLLRRLLGRTGHYATLHRWPFCREALCPRDNRFELSAGTKCRYRLRLYLHRLHRARIARHPRCATALLEYTEPCDGDALTLVHCTDDGVDDVLHRGGGLPTI